VNPSSGKSPKVAESSMEKGVSSGSAQWDTPEAIAIVEENQPNPPTARHAGP